MIDDEIERRKDKFDLRPALDFVEKNLGIYRANLGRYLASPTNPETDKWLGHVCFDTLQPGSQLNPDVAREMLLRMPTNLVRASGLENIDYAWQNVVVSPVFDKNGNFQKIECLDLDKFSKSDKHQTRILIGCTSSDGKTIYPTAIPATVSSGAEAIKLYQIAVLLHEFMHTIINPMKGMEDSMVLCYDTGGENYRSWERRFLESFSREPKFTSLYAESYADALISGNAEEVTRALREQICEAFAAYWLDIAPNRAGYTSFRQYPFGGKNSPSERYGLMERLVGARFVKTI
jgi:hypothetical protein